MQLLLPIVLDDKLSLKAVAATAVGRSCGTVADFVALLLAGLHSENAAKAAATKLSLGPLCLPQRFLASTVKHLGPAEALHPELSAALDVSGALRTGGAGAAATRETLIGMIGELPDPVRRHPDFARLVVAEVCASADSDTAAIIANLSPVLVKVVHEAANGKAGEDDVCMSCLDTFAAHIYGNILPESQFVATLKALLEQDVFTAAALRKWAARDPKEASAPYVDVLLKVAPVKEFLQSLPTA